MVYTKKHFDGLSQALGAKDVVKASFIINGFYKSWDQLDADMQRDVKSLEPVYLTLVKGLTRN